MSQPQHESPRWKHNQVLRQDTHVSPLLLLRKVRRCQKHNSTVKTRSNFHILNNRMRLAANEELRGQPRFESNIAYLMENKEIPAGKEDWRSLWSVSRQTDLSRVLQEHHTQPEPLQVYILTNCQADSHQSTWSLVIGKPRSPSKVSHTHSELQVEALAFHSTSLNGLTYPWSHRCNFKDFRRRHISIKDSKWKELWSKFLLADSSVRFNPINQPS